jgi:DNA-3-methyladenine glycosylase II
VRKPQDGAAFPSAMPRAVRTSLVPPRLASLPKERAQLEYSSRSIVFARDGASLLRAWGTPDRPFVIGVEPDRERWTVRAWGCGPATARRAVRELFSLDDPIEEFYRQTRAEPVLRGTERSFRGLRLPRDANLYEALLHAIIGQQLSVVAANALKRRLLERYGRQLEADGIEVPVVPSPGSLVAAGVVGLRKLGLSGAKSAALVALARWSSGAPRPSDLRGGPLERALAQLEHLQGVGRWTAENALLRGAGRRDVFVAGDLGIRVALERFGALPRSAPEERARSWARRRYPGWGSYATLYLWRRLVTERAGGSAG